MKKFLGVILAVLLLVGCGGSGSETATISSDDFVYSNGNGKLALNQEMDPDALGEYTYSETESCGYDGLDKIYTYSDCEVYTYPQNGKDYVLYIDLLDSAKTSKNIQIGSTLDDIKSAYGENYTEEGEYIVYQLDNQKLKFLMIDEKVVFIEYSYEG